MHGEDLQAWIGAQHPRTRRNDVTAEDSDRDEELQCLEHQRKEDVDCALF